MLNDDGQDGESPCKLNERTSQCSTAVQFSEVYEELFYVGPQQHLENQVKLRLTQDDLTFTHKNQLKTIPLILTLAQESIYLRNHETVYAIKLSRNSDQTIFSTFDKEHFIALYVQLAKKCILTGFDKHYRVGEHIGTGTFGKVYNGYNIFSNENVALKVVCKEEVSKIKGGIESVYNEIQILQKLKKVHISPLISTFETVDCFIMVLEKGNGGTLIEYLKGQSHAYNEQMLKSIFKQVLENVNILHEAGFIHRDIKPENIICKESACPSVFLCDYGISIEKSQKYGMVEDHHITGTIGYIAPEIVNEQSYDEKCDIFSIGSLFYYLFTGRKLFQSKNIWDLKAYSEDSSYIDEKMENLNCMGFEIRDLIENLLKFDPIERFSAKEALKHPYFKDSQSFLPNLGEFDETLRSFIENKISHYWH